LLEFWSLISDDFNKQLVFETFRCYSEVDKGDFDANFRQVVGVGQLGGYD
jgi:hypothetical protein